MVFDAPQRWTGYVSRLEGKRVGITIQLERINRTLAQNRWWWAMLIPIFSDYTGYDKDEAHAILKAVFLKQEKVLPSGEVVEVSGSTAKLSKKEFSELVEKVCRWLAEQGCYVPQPGEHLEAKL